MEQKVLNEEVLSLPPELDNLKKKKPKRSHLFSGAIFRESLKSNIKSLSIVSLGNGALIAVVIGILSTLNINATASAMKNLFSSAGDESTIKSGSVSYYNAYYNSALAYQETYDSIDALNNLITQNVDLVSNETVKSSIGLLEKVYMNYYSASQSDDYAYEQVMIIANNQIGSLTSNEEEKAIMLGIIDGYFSIYKTDKTLSYNEMMYKVVPNAFANVINQKYNLEDSSLNKVKVILSNSINEIYVLGNKKEEVTYKYGMELGKLLSSDEDAIYLLSNIEDTFLEDTNSWLNEPNYKEETIKNEIVEKVVSTIEDNAYYAYLPDFIVDYRTNELGYPITLIDTGKKDSLGNTIYEEKELHEYDESKFIKLQGDLGTKASSLEKMRKEILTGEAYTQDEIDQAKLDAKETVKEIEEDLNSFMNDFIIREDNKNSYFDGSNVIESTIVSRVIDDISNKAKDELVKDYNEKYNANITDVNEITSAEDRTSGKDTMNLIYSYSAGSISSYKKIYQDKINEGYSTSDANLIASNIAGRGIMDQLPDDVHSSLKEMGEMNTYGVVLGGIGFAMASLLIPIGYTIMLSNDLVCKKVENGSLAFTFSTPIKRNTYIFTEGMYLIFSETIMAIVLTGVALLARYFGILAGSTDIETSITINNILMFGLGNYLVSLAISSICFFTSSLFNKSSNSVGIGGGISIFFLICSILGLFGSDIMPGTVRIEAMNYFNYVTILSLFDSNAVLNGDNIYWYKLIGLAGIILVMYGLAFKVFDKKDLPL